MNGVIELRRHDSPPCRIAMCRMVYASLLLLAGSATLPVPRDVSAHRMVIARKLVLMR
ncbi:MAG: hypothetical protein JW913_05045 [Chitinispirillaceae bacterium]|nr:hypothetical protein [Chitinispirillaceae bacterium]